jgi:deoxyribodipyrimidine photo-lyase
VTPPVILHWLRNDLRLHDNEPLAWGAQNGSAFLPVYCFDPRQFGRTRLGFPRMGAFRTRFLLESLADLRSSLRELGSELAIRQGEPEEAVARLAGECGARVVVAHAETTSEETTAEARLRDALAAHGCELRLFWGSTLVHRDDLPFDAARDLPDTFADFRRLVEKHWVARPPMSVPRAFPPVPNVPPGRVPDYGTLGVNAPSPDSWPGCGRGIFCAPSRKRGRDWAEQTTRRCFRPGYRMDASRRASSTPRLRNMRSAAWRTNRPASW